MGKGVWISWENQRRSVELATALDCRLHILEYAGKMRYPKCLFHTLSIMFRNNSRIVFVQNPSMILAAFVCLYKKLRQTVVVVDRHSTFKSKSKKGSTLSYIMYDLLNRFTLKTADITVVTNSNLAEVVRKTGGTPYVLPDKIPRFGEIKPTRLDGKFNVLFVCSYARDEPVHAVIDAMRITDPEVTLYISGNHKKLDRATVDTAPENVQFTGYLKEEEYAALLHAVDAVMVLTTSDNTMMCGCYEAISASKPLITSNKDVLRDYFKGCIFVENNRDDISRGIGEALAAREVYSRNSTRLKESIDKEWAITFKGLNHKVQSCLDRWDIENPVQSKASQF